MRLAAPTAHRPLGKTSRSRPPSPQGGARDDGKQRQHAARQALAKPPLPQLGCLPASAVKLQQCVPCWPAHALAVDQQLVTWQLGKPRHQTLAELAGCGGLTAKDAAAAGPGRASARKGGQRPRSTACRPVAAARSPLQPHQGSSGSQAATPGLGPSTISTLHRDAETCAWGLHACLPASSSFCSARASASAWADAAACSATALPLTPSCCCWPSGNRSAVVTPGCCRCCRCAATRRALTRQQCASRAR